MYNFSAVIDSILAGKRITKLEWEDRRAYILLKDELLQIHKAGESEETLHPWILNEADLMGNDYVVL